MRKMQVISIPSEIAQANGWIRIHESIVKKEKNDQKMKQNLFALNDLEINSLGQKPTVSDSVEKTYTGNCLQTVKVIRRLTKHLGSSKEKKEGCRDLDKIEI